MQRWEASTSRSWPISHEDLDRTLQTQASSAENAHHLFGIENVLTMDSPNTNTTAEDESQLVSRRIQRLSLHLTPIPNSFIRDHHQLQLLTCARVKLSVNTALLSDFLRGKHRGIQEKVYEYFKSRPDLQTPVEISKDEHRELCMRQLLGLVREAGIRPFRYIVEDPSKYFAIAEAAGSVDMSLGIKLGVQYR